MIESRLGKVSLTKENYNLCDMLHCSKEDVDSVVKATLTADLVAILDALGKKYDPVTALEIWLKVADIVLESED